jgi:putative membrane protein insertion efficiency factor
MSSLLVLFIRAYRVIFAPLKVMAGLHGCCRFTPSCSSYMEEAVCTHGVCRGLGLGARRLLRCHPWGGLGHDPVPPVEPGRIIPARAA